NEQFSEMAPNERGAAGNKDGTISVCNLEPTLDIHLMASASSFFEHYGDFKLGATSIGAYWTRHTRDTSSEMPIDTILKRRPEISSLEGRNYNLKMRVGCRRALMVTSMCAPSTAEPRPAVLTTPRLVFYFAALMATEAYLWLFKIYDWWAGITRGFLL